MMAAEASKATKELCLAREVTNAVLLLERGLAEIQASRYSTNEYHPALLLLSSGFERLMKCVLCLFELASTGKYPTVGKMKCWGHKLDRLLGQITKRCSASNYADGPQGCRRDSELFRDETLRAFLNILTDFGEGGRYHNFDVVGAAEEVGQYPEQRWLALELRAICEQTEEKDALTNVPEGDADPFLRKARQRTIALLKEFAAALARLFMLGPLGPQGKAMLPYIIGFLDRTDQDLPRGGPSHRSGRA